MGNRLIERLKADAFAYGMTEGNVGVRLPLLSRLQRSDEPRPRVDCDRAALRACGQIGSIKIIGNGCFAAPSSTRECLKAETQALLFTVDELSSDGVFVC